MIGHALDALLLVSCGCSSMAAPSLRTEATNGAPRVSPDLPFFLGHTPEHQEKHVYSQAHERAHHTADGPGLSTAETGQMASFTVRLVREASYPAVENWNTVSGRFIYVWIAGEDQIFAAEVINNFDGTLTASYTSDFPGEYLVHVEDINLDYPDEGRPIVGSPFSLTITGQPTLDITGLPLCGTEDESVEEAFWKPGTWISSRLADGRHGVARDGWVFQPKTCAYDTFSYDDLMLLASLEEQTWIVTLGDSVTRGIFLTLVDMVLAQGQKDSYPASTLAKCWGYADIQIGSLRITYQDMRLNIVPSLGDSLECHNEKLASKSTASYALASETFLSSVIFQDGEPWPTVIVAPSKLAPDPHPNTAIELPLDSLPKSWEGTLLMMSNLGGLNHGYDVSNPTAAALGDVGLKYHNLRTLDGGIQQMTRYHEQDPRVTFMNVFPMYQHKLFENEATKNDKRAYGRSPHYHRVANVNEHVTYEGSRMVVSTMTEMISHIVVMRAIGTKAALYEKVVATADIGWQSASVRKSFQVCSDCPASMLPFHVKAIPEPKCVTVESLPADAVLGQVWNNELCPDWCMATSPEGQTPTGSGMVDVRVCSPSKPGPQP